MRQRRPYDPAGDALEELSNWCRKYYSFSFTGGPFSQPGDECYIKLTGGGRTVDVDEWELARRDNDGVVEQMPTLGELIHAALRKWHDDTTPKRFHVIYEGDPPRPSVPWAETEWRRLAGGSPDISLFVTASTERDAIAAVRKLVDGKCVVREVWETSTR